MSSWTLSGESGERSLGGLLAPNRSVFVLLLVLSLISVLLEKSERSSRARRRGLVVLEPFIEEVADVDVLEGIC